MKARPDWFLLVVIGVLYLSTDGIANAAVFLLERVR